jgi:hypothetical protein
LAIRAAVDEEQSRAGADGQVVGEVKWERSSLPAPAQRIRPTMARGVVAKRWVMAYRSGGRGLDGSLTWSEWH